MKTIENRQFEEERALYHLKNTRVSNCLFAGTADGESALKESRNIFVENSRFELRYPLWHARKFSLAGTVITETARAPLWYSVRGNIENCRFESVKCLRECADTRLKDCSVISPEFGWRCKNLKLENCKIDAVYCLFESKNITIDRLEMSGKYSFQYIKNATITNSSLDTKDAFWHSKNVRVENSTLKGEYLGWFSENLTLINCRISGTQPFCYCKKLTLVNCTMENCDLAFEYSEVNADIRGNVLSVKNPKSGTITADGIGEIIRGNAVCKTSQKQKAAKISLRSPQSGPV